MSEDASLKTLAASRIARGTNRIHTISYNPSVVNEPDYLICYQCGFILRLLPFPKGETTVLIGENNSGKTSTVTVASDGT